jgi:hypothetical protein
MRVPYGLTVNMTVNVAESALDAISINELEVSLMIEWE